MGMIVFHFFLSHFDNFGVALFFLFMLRWFSAFLCLDAMILIVSSVLGSLHACIAYRGT